MHKKLLLVLVSVVAAGILGMLIDVNVGLDGNFSIVVAIAVASAFIVHSNKK